MNQFKKIVVIVDSIDVNDSSGSKANVALITNLTKIFSCVKVLHYTRKDIQLKNAECFSIIEKKYNLFYLLSRTQRVIQRIFKVNLAKYLERIFGFSFTFFNDVNSIKTNLKSHILNNADIILTLSKGASFRPHYVVNKTLNLHNKWMAYIHDPYPFVCYPPPYKWKEPGYKNKVKFLKEVSENAKYAAFPSLLLKNWMSNYFPNFMKTGIVIPHQNFDVKLNDLKKIKYLNNNKFNLLHAGSLLKQRNPEGLIDGFKMFLERNPEAKTVSKLFLLGRMSYHKGTIEKYQSIANELFLKDENVEFNEVYALQKEVSVNIVLEAIAEISPFLPGKFPHCVAANKPILYLGPKNSETFRLLGEDYSFHSVANDVKQIADCIEKLYKLWMQNNSKLELNRKDLEYYISVSHLEEILSKLIVSK